MLSTPPALIAVIGRIEPPLLAAWVRHYRWLGVERFLIAFHFPDHFPDTQRHELQAACRELGIIPIGTSTPLAGAARRRRARPPSAPCPVRSHGRRRVGRSGV
jgi:hypothetical protein